MTRTLTVTDHRRDSAGLTYVYPVVSRRAGGISVGINFNPNNACNWRCLYCQVPDLQRGTAPPLDKARLQRELRGLLESILDGTFYQRFQVPPDHRTLKDISISGNGEPTTLAEFDQAIAAIEQTLAEIPLPPQIGKVIISNGSLIQRPEVQRGLARWNKLGGELWFKVDSATAEGIRRSNGAAITPERVLANLETAARLCPIWIQTCLFMLDGESPSQEEQHAYLDFLATTTARHIPLRGVLLYGLARPSMQPEAERLAPLPASWMEEFAEKIRTLGLKVKLTP
ncbi:radical SAM protein [Methylohalobius crimeensis]|uniref:radical SAM protein n=1 Tax=Methylohalobius crimeensis TaxID=244365 RepID=UPI0003B483D0|nr:radical SAM protein [Methylohalobius crimeensis]